MPVARFFVAADCRSRIHNMDEFRSVPFETVIALVEDRRIAS